MRKFLWFSKVALLTTGRCALLVVGAVVLELLFVTVWLEWFLRQLSPVILAALPEKHQRILMHMVTAPPKYASADTKVSDE
jgi:hypothetical protein